MRPTSAGSRAPSLIPVLGALSCGFLVGPWTDRDTVQYQIGGAMVGAREADRFRDPSQLKG